MDPHKGTSWRFPTDVLVEILRRLPPNTRRRFRLVCRSWRKLVDKRSFLHRSKTLVVTDQGCAFVMDDQTGHRKDLWSSSSTRRRCRGMRVVGTCNGLLCLCDDGVPGGAITLANPVTGETLDLPPLPLPPACGDAGREHRHHWHQAYSFGYHPTTGRYKVVHLPCRFDEECEFHTVQVFTLGEAAWREVVITIPESRCDLVAGTVDIDGTTYWTTAAGKLMTFDLEDESVATVGFTVPARKFLTVVHGMLGIASRDTVAMMDNTEVWVMQRKPRGLVHWYTLQVSPVRKPKVHQHITRPHFVQNSGHVLTWGLTRGYGGLYKHKPRRSHTINGTRGAVEINEKNQGTMVADIKTCSDTWAFKYVETKESLSAYRLGD